jgi:hypothetical protein
MIDSRMYAGQFLSRMFSVRSAQEIGQRLGDADRLAPGEMSETSAIAESSYSMFLLLSCISSRCSLILSSPTRPIGSAGPIIQPVWTDAPCSEIASYNSLRGSLPSGKVPVNSL